MRNKKDNVFRTFGATPEQIIGYVYTGLLSLLCLALSDSALVKQLKDSMGTLLLAVFVVTVGLAGYTVYFKIFGELILFPLQYLLHHALDFLRGRRGERHTATLSFIHYLGVPWPYCHAAYQEIKNEFYPGVTGPRIQLAHGELNVLYLTAIVLFAFGVRGLLVADAAWPFLAVGLAFLICAFTADTIQQSLETQMIRSSDRASLVKYLTERGLLSCPPKEKGCSVESMEHYGLVTSNIKRFEDFWCVIVGFRKVWESTLSKKKLSSLFGIESSALVRRYSLGDATELEVHVFDSGVVETTPCFNAGGFNHICLRVADRQKFIATLPQTVPVHKNENRTGWDNIFIRD